jgi:hypothetical protein
MSISVIGKLKPQNSGAFPVAEDIDVQGGLQIRVTTADRDSIPALNRKAGMLVYVTGNATYYQLGSGLTNTDWTTANFGSSSSGTAAGGDLAGTYPNPSVAQLQGRALLATAPSTNQVIAWNGSAWAPTSLTSDMVGAAFAISFSGGGNVQVGASVVTPAFTATYNQSITSAILTDSEGTAAKDVTSTPLSFSSNATVTKSTFNASATFTLTAVSAGGITKAAAVAYRWYQLNFYGVGPAGQTTATFIQSLGSSFLASSRGTTFSANAGASQKVYYAYRTAFGAASFTVGGFAGGFSLVSSTIAVTNSNGVTENYSLYESDNLGLGSVTVSVS